MLLRANQARGALPIFRLDNSGQPLGFRPELTMVTFISSLPNSKTAAGMHRLELLGCVAESRARGGDLFFANSMNLSNLDILESLTTPVQS